MRDLTPTLIVRLRQGQEDAAALLEELYRQRLTHFCAGYLGSQEEAEDAVQSVFYKVLRSDAVPDDFRAWLYRIARNHCLDVLKARGRRRDDQALPEDSRLDSELTGHLTRLIRGERRSHLRSVLAELPVHQREVLRLRYGEELSRTEIARVLDIPESVVKSRLYEGLERLRRHDSLAG